MSPGEDEFYKWCVSRVKEQAESIYADLITFAETEQLELDWVVATFLSEFSKVMAKKKKE